MPIENGPSLFVSRCRLLILALCATSVLSLACSKRAATFSLLSDENTFQQNSARTNGNIDILWVIDNSGSMESSQQNVADNFERFIDKFNEKGFNYRMAVTTSDAYREMFGAPAEIARFRNGNAQTGPNGYHIVEPSTPQLREVFMANILQGISGHGDERVFQSITAAINYPPNTGFVRPEGFLAVIIVSDEDDFSWDGATTIGGQYSNANLHPVDRYVTYLDALTGATADNRSSKYNVNSIAILDQNCLNTLNGSIPGRKIGRRYIELSQKTNGIVGSLCGDFGSTLSEISAKIIELSTQFFLSRAANPSTLEVFVDGSSVSRLNSQDPQPWNGFLYHEETNSITFHGTAVPGPGASIAVRFDPLSLR